MKKLSILLVMLLAACTETAPPPEVRTYKAPLEMQNGLFCAHFASGSAAEVDRWCRQPSDTPEAINGCHRPVGHPMNNLPYPIIYHVTPRDWNDQRALAVAGHEVVHLRGGKHE